MKNETAEDLLKYSKLILGALSSVHHPKKSRLGKCGVCWDREMLRMTIGKAEHEARGKT